MTIGAYAFTINDWKELGYPVDLWLEWNSKYFDQLALVIYGEMEIDPPSNVTIIKEPSIPDRTNEDFFLRGKEKAQKLLNTDWKVMLDTDEFVPKRIDTTNLDRKKAYAISERDFFGNLETEIVNVFPKFYYRIHYGNRPIGRAGAAGVTPPYAANFVFGNFVNDVLRKIFKKREFKPYYDPSTNKNFEVWHTSTVRKPDAMAKKWRIHINAAINSDPSLGSYKDFLKNVQSTFDYRGYKKIWPAAILKKVDLSIIPDILRKNAERFNFAIFDESEYD
ncbi:hypothetical protein [Cuniculiplasma divulgatum]|uniref:Uncharacterized protein n=1 Tax=Cuniculiplasma divulgatum TaxID=1673428 RepID=A0A1N5UKC5_9ARCH|nr:hypothetical protein [Cuniculiplasma divulgatum]SIM61151.1 hypothetical protein CSP5_1011 [Cuniculiplasma divulgatum]SJK84848.1 hypothetical protein CPM_1026 [Cuniculiplasma divulgatum]